MCVVATSIATDGLAFCDAIGLATRESADSDAALVVSEELDGSGSLPQVADSVAITLIRIATITMWLEFREDLAAGLP